MASTQEEIAVAEVCRTAVSARPAHGGLTCLVASASKSRREDLRNAAQTAGFDALASADADAASQCAARTMVQLAVVDIESAPPELSVGLASLVKKLAGHNGMLLVLCGHLDQPDEEIWARQLGVWLYLPGVSDCKGLTSLFGEAHELATRMTHVTAR